MRHSRICDALRAAGLEVWFDQSELRGGDAWDASIRRKIKDCALFVPLISANTDARSEGYFRLEWKLAVDRSHLIADDKAFLLPVVIDPMLNANARVPDRFRDVQWTDVPAGQVPANFVEQVTRILSPDDRILPTADAQARRTIPPAMPTLRAPRRRVLLGVAALVALLAVGAVVNYQRATRSAAIGLVAVLPFENATGDPAIEYLSDGISESLINKLSSLNGLTCHLANVRLRFQGHEDGPDGGRPKAWRRRPRPRQPRAAGPESGHHRGARERPRRYAIVGREVRAPGGRHDAGRGRDRDHHCADAAPAVEPGREGQAHAHRNVRPGRLSPVPQGARLSRGQPAGDGQERRLLPAGRGPGARLRHGPRGARRGLHASRRFSARPIAPRPWARRGPP